MAALKRDKTVQELGVPEGYYHDRIAPFFNAVMEHYGPLGDKSWEILMPCIAAMGNLSKAYLIKNNFELADYPAENAAFHQEYIAPLLPFLRRIKIPADDCMACLRSIDELVMHGAQITDKGMVVPSRHEDAFKNFAEARKFDEEIKSDALNDSITNLFARHARHFHMPHIPSDLGLSGTGHSFPPDISDDPPPADAPAFSPAG